MLLNIHVPNLRSLELYERLDAPGEQLRFTSLGLGRADEEGNLDDLYRV